MVDRFILLITVPVNEPLNENNNVETAEGWLGFADKDYPLAQLLRRVYAAGWEPKSFAHMRDDLHPKVEATIFEGATV